MLALIVVPLSQLNTATCLGVRPAADPEPTAVQTLGRCAASQSAKSSRINHDWVCQPRLRSRARGRLSVAVSVLSGCCSAKRVSASRTVRTRPFQGSATSILNWVIRAVIDDATTDGWAGCRVANCPSARACGVGLTAALR